MNVLVTWLTIDDGVVCDATFDPHHYSWSQLVSMPIFNAIEIFSDAAMISMSSTDGPMTIPHELQQYLDRACPQ